MARKVKAGGSWHDVSKRYRRIGGRWRQVSASYIKINGVWRQVMALQYPVGLIEQNVGNLVGTYSLQYLNSGQIRAEISGYCANNSANVAVGFRLYNIPATRKVEYGFAAQASNENAIFQVWNDTELSQNIPGGSGGGSIFHAKNHVDFIYVVAANASSGPVTASFTITGITVEGVAV